jgi:hypothetical protein
MSKFLAVILVLLTLSGCQEPFGDNMPYTGEYAGWSASGTLEVGNEHKAVQLQANFVDPGDYTVQFSVSNYDTNTDFPTPTAEITWSVEGNSVRRIVTVNNGLSISGTGQGVKVVIRDASMPTAPATLYDVSVQVVLGTRPAAQQPPTYTPLITGTDGTTRPGAMMVSALTSIVVPVPQDAGIISMFTTVATVPTPTILTEGDVQIRQNRTGGFPLKAYDPKIATWVPIAPLSTELTFVNNTASSVFFSVTFGIDG